MKQSKTIKSRSKVKKTEVRRLLKELERLPEILAAKKAEKLAKLRFAYDVFGDAVKKALGETYLDGLEKTRYQA